MLMVEYVCVCACVYVCVCVYPNLWGYHSVMGLGEDRDEWYCRSGR